MKPIKHLGEEKIREKESKLWIRILSYTGSVPWGTDDNSQINIL